MDREKVKSQTPCERALDGLPFAFMLYEEFIGRVLGKSVVHPFDTGTHPIPNAFRYRFYIEDSFTVLLEEGCLQSENAWELRKISLDMELKKGIEKNFAIDEILSILYKAIEEYVQLYEYNVSWIPQETVFSESYFYFFRNTLNVRNSLEALLQMYFNYAHEKLFVERLMVADKLLKTFSKLEWVDENTSENRLLNHAPLARWWYYVENYDAYKQE
jgi:hypothetical protein